MNYDAYLPKAKRPKKKQKQNKTRGNCFAAHEIIYQRLKSIISIHLIIAWRAIFYYLAVLRADYTKRQWVGKLDGASEMFGHLEMPRLELWKSGHNEICHDRY